MNINDIRKLDNLMKFEYAKDMNGEIISNGDICVSKLFAPFIRYSNDNIIIDFSRLIPKKISYSFNYEMLSNEEGIPIIDSDRVSSLYIIEYFKIDKSNIWPFYHCYNNFNYRFWFNKTKGDNFLKLKINDLSKIFIRLPKSIDLNIMKNHLRKQVECNDKLDYIELKVEDFKCWNFILKALRGIKQRERWSYKCNDFPNIHFNTNDSIENELTIENMITKDNGLGFVSHFYNTSEENRKLYLYCQHPKKNHKEYFYIYEHDNIKDI